MSKSQNRIKKIRGSLHRAMSKDRFGISRELVRMEARLKGGADPAHLDEDLARVERRLESSVARTARRRLGLPALSFPESLPVTARRKDIVEAIRQHPVVIITGETGSGKTTQIPKMCLEAGRGIHGMIGCTQPRRIAAITVAQRISEEMGDEAGGAVGYKIRFEERMGRDTYIKIMTDGILLVEIQSNPRLLEYDTIIVDEAHERSLNIDFILGLLKNLVRKRRDLKVIITSATIDAEKFARAFDGAPVLEVSGRMYPVELRYAPPESDSGQEDAGYVEAAVAAVDELRRGRDPGDILIFMPTEQDIRETCDLLAGRNDRDVTVLPLYARLTPAEQRRVFRPAPGRKIIVATNVAETSITIPGIRYVIDTGLARLSRYNARTRTTGLPVEPVSKSSADQRKGRCGRVQNGICIRLYSEEDYEGRPLFTPPEILRSNLAEVVLRMLALRIGDIATFPFIDPPSPRNIHAGIDMLEELGAIAKGELKGRQAATGYELTDRGRLMARMPLDPRVSRMIIEAEKEGCLDEMTVIAAALSIQDPRERPFEQEKEAERMHGAFTNPASDFITYLNMWSRFRDRFDTFKSQSRMRKFCREHFLSYRRMREWKDVHGQIREILEEEKIAGQRPAAGAARGGRDPEAFYGALHRAVLSGYLSNIAVKKEKNIYTAGGGRHVMIFPGSGLFNRGGPWIVAAEQFETTRLYARTAANIENVWLEPLGGDLCRRTYSNPRWDRKRGEVVALEQVTLFGLTIEAARRTSFGRVDPGAASDIFIRSALVEGDIEKPPAFLLHNRALIERLASLEDKVRRRNILVGQDALAGFYADRLTGIYDTRSLHKRIRESGGDEFLRMKEEDVLKYFPGDEELALYPDALPLGRKPLPLTYRFDPGRSDDGVTASIPVNRLPSVPDGILEWGIRGQLKEKVIALIKGLPKEYRKRLVPVQRTVESILAQITWGEGSLPQQLSTIIAKHVQMEIPTTLWDLEALPDHLRMRVAVVDSKGLEITSGRDIRRLREGVARVEETTAVVEARRRWEKRSLAGWNFDDLPEKLDIEDEEGHQAVLLPALVARDGDVDLRLFLDRREALNSHVRGVIGLYELHFKKELRYLRKQLTLPEDMKRKAPYFGGPAELEGSLYRETLRRLFGLNIRTKASFLNHAAQIAPRILPAGQELLNEIRPILEAYHRTRQTLHGMEASGPKNRPMQEFFTEIRAHLDRVVPKNFLELTPPEGWPRIIRYLRALTLRAEKGLVNLERDRARAREIRAFDELLGNLQRDLAPSASEEKKKMIDELAWMIEEYRVSLFAQELRAALPVSRKRLAAKVKEIENML